MAVDFTAKQKEIVARKMGYEGPMQMFDEYLASTPSDSQRYAAITSKFAERMAKGGSVVKKFVDGGDDADTAIPPEKVATTPITTVANVEGGAPTMTGAPAYEAAITDTTLAGLEAKVTQAVSDAEGAKVKTISGEAGLKSDKAKNAQAAQDALKMVVGLSKPDLKYDLNGDGKVDLQDGIGYSKLASGLPLGFEPNTESNYKDFNVYNEGVAKVGAPTAITPTTITAETTQPTLETAQAKQVAETGVLAEGAKVTGVKGALSPEAIAAAQTVGAEYKAPVVAGVRTTAAEELVTPVTEAAAVKATAEQTAAPVAVTAAQGVVTPEQLVQAQTIKEEDMAQATAIVSEGLAPDATVVAARLDKFTVDAGTLAQAAQGDVNAQSTVQGQLADLMKSFDDGKTPAWAAGAIRAANAAMASRGLGSSSMAATAIFQAAMESALPIASQDAQTFAQMGIANLNNRQQTALTNAAAQQGLALQNLSNEQQARVANAANSFALQSQNLSNMQQTMLANTQIRAALQGQNLSNMQQAAVVNAARYAEQANINLNNIQQTALHNSSMQVQVDIANTSNRQQSSLANAQLEAALQGKILDNKQQAAVINATRVSENANMTFTAAQTTALHNSEVMKSIGLAELSAAQSATIANAAAAATMDLANLNNLQQAAVQNAKAFLETDMKNLDNKQQMAVLKSQQIAQSITSDAAAKNAAAATNATNKLEADKINETLKLTADQYNAAEKNKIAVANMNAENELAKFNAQEDNDRAEFNARMSTEISLANTKILADISVANTAAINAANAVNAKNATDLSSATYAQLSQTYRDKLEMSWKTGEAENDRVTQIAVATITKNAAANAAQITSDAASSASWGKLAIDVVKNWSSVKSFITG